MKNAPGPARGQKQKNYLTLYIQYPNLSILRIRPIPIPINDMVCANPACRGARFRTRSKQYYEHLSKMCRVIAE